MDHDLQFAPVRSKSRVRVGMLVGSTSVTAGGVSEVVHSLALALGRRPEISLEVFAPDDGRGGRGYGDVPLHLVRTSGPSSFGYAPGLVSAMIAADLDVLHVHGLWMYISVAARRWARATGRPYMVSPHGMLDPWALGQGRVKKRLARLLYEDGHLRKAACLHALCLAEAHAFREAGVTAPISVLPNGVDLPAAAPDMPPWRSRMPGDAKVALFLGRVTPKKRVTALIGAFDRSAAGTPWQLVIVGPVDRAYRDEVGLAAAQAIHGDRIHIVGPAYGDDRAAAYASADLFVLPSISEGLPMAALEAFANGMPALLTPRCNLPEAAERGAAIEAAATEDGIAQGLRRFFEMTADERDAMGRNALRLAEDVFNWETVAERMADLYGRIGSRQAQPSGLLRGLRARAGLPA